MGSQFSPEKKNDDDAAPRGPTLTDEEAARIARRKLLRIGAYAVPIVIGTFSVRSAEAATCPPNTQCNPRVACHPDCWPRRERERRGEASVRRARLRRRRVLRDGD